MAEYRDADHAWDAETLYPERFRMTEPPELSEADSEEEAQAILDACDQQAETDRDRDDYADDVEAQRAEMEAERAMFDYDDFHGEWPEDW